MNCSSKYGDLWRDALRDEEGRYSERTLSDEAERRFWKSYFHGKKQILTDPYSEDVWTAVRQILGERHFQRILEIGPGWGNYTLRLAALAKEISCVDISPDVLDYVQILLKSHGYEMRAHCTKWEDFEGADGVSDGVGDVRDRVCGGTHDAACDAVCDAVCDAACDAAYDARNGRRSCIRAAKPNERYDLLFAFNCFYRMPRIEEVLLKMDRMAKFRIIGTNSGPELEYEPELEKRLGVSIRYRKFSHLHLANILYELGIVANVRAVRSVRDYVFDSMEDVLSNIRGKMQNPDAVRAEEILDIVSPYFTIDSFGKYRYTRHFYAGLLYW